MGTLGREHVAEHCSLDGMVRHNEDSITRRRGLFAEQTLSVPYSPFSTRYSVLELRTQTSGFTLNVPWGLTSLTGLNLAASTASQIARGDRSFPF